MKQKTNKDLIIFIILIPVFLGIAFYIQSGTRSNIPAYSIDNKTKNGTSVFFEALRELDYPIEKSIKPLGKHDTEALQVIVPGGEFDLQSEEVKEWIEKGGTLVYFSPGDFLFINYGQLISDDDFIMTYEYGKGKVISTNIKHITNRTLLRSRDNAYNIIKKLGEQPFNKIYFNETYLYIKAEQKTLWGSLSLDVKFILFQGIILLIGFFYYKGKRFGKPQPLYEEVERIENEYLYSAASLYKHAGCWDLIAENYYKSFLRQMKRSHDNWLGYWQEQELPMQGKAKQIYDFMSDRNRKTKAKEYEQIVILLNQLTSILNKRRDSYWKTLKTTQ
jgi:hypothetical protein